MHDDRNEKRHRTLADEMAEARAVQAEGNIGRARTCARRAVGMALREKIGIGPKRSDYASTFINGLYRLAEDQNFPAEVRTAAARLVDRSKEDRTSAAVNPVEDAEIILEYFKLK
jgi:transcription initiation factor TFIIIB Brf1 subunit/transcription initiation factor TFIIB